LKERLVEIATQSGFEILAVEVMPEPVHLLVSAPPKYAPAEIVRLYTNRYMG
jgi:putative transposase